MNPLEEVTLTYSSVVVKDGKPLVCVCFERGKDYAEGVLPECDIVKSNGFSKDEVDALAAYLKANRKDLVERSKMISGILNMMK